MGSYCSAVPEERSLCSVADGRKVKRFFRLKRKGGNVFVATMHVTGHSDVKVLSRCDV